MFENALSIDEDEHQYYDAVQETQAAWWREEFHSHRLKNIQASKFSWAFGEPKYPANGYVMH